MKNCSKIQLGRLSVVALSLIVSGSITTSFNEGLELSERTSGIFAGFKTGNLQTGGSELLLAQNNGNQCSRSCNDENSSYGSNVGSGNK